MWKVLESIWVVLLSVRRRSMRRFLPRIKDAEIARDPNWRTISKSV
jgi:hypothetical protein